MRRYSPRGWRVAGHIPRLCAAARPGSQPCSAAPSMPRSRLPMLSGNSPWRPSAGPSSSLSLIVNRAIRRKFGPENNSRPSTVHAWYGMSRRQSSTSRYARAIDAPYQASSNSCSLHVHRAASTRAQCSRCCRCSTYSSRSGSAPSLQCSRRLCRFGRWRRCQPVPLNELRHIVTHRPHRRRRQDNPCDDAHHAAALDCYPSARWSMSA
jgi:hypothetical protein